jgi:hypothetical protein
MQHRVQLYNRFTQILGVPAGGNLTCQQADDDVTAGAPDGRARCRRETRSAPGICQAEIRS